MKKIRVLCLFCIFFASSCTMRNVQNHLSQIPPSDATRRIAITSALSKLPEVSESVVFVDGHTALIGIVTEADSRVLRNRIAQTVLCADSYTFSVSTTTSESIIEKIRQLSQAQQVQEDITDRGIKTADRISISLLFALQSIISVIISSFPDSGNPVPAIQTIHPYESAHHQTRFRHHHTPVS